MSNEQAHENRAFNELNLANMSLAQIIRWPRYTMILSTTLFLFGMFVLFSVIDSAYVYVIILCVYIGLATYSFYEFKVGEWHIAELYHMLNKVDKRYQALRGRYDDASTYPFIGESNRRPAPFYAYDMEAETTLLLAVQTLHYVDSVLYDCYTALKMVEQHVVDIKNSNTIAIAGNIALVFPVLVSVLRRSKVGQYLAALHTPMNQVKEQIDAFDSVKQLTSQLPQQILDDVTANEVILHRLDDELNAEEQQTMKKIGYIEKSINQTRGYFQELRELLNNEDLNDDMVVRAHSLAVESKELIERTNNDLGEITNLRRSKEEKLNQILLLLSELRSALDSEETKIRSIRIDDIEEQYQKWCVKINQFDDLPIFPEIYRHIINICTRFQSLIISERRKLENRIEILRTTEVARGQLGAIEVKISQYTNCTFNETTEKIAKNRDTLAQVQTLATDTNHDLVTTAVDQAKEALVVTLQIKDEFDNSCRVYEKLRNCNQLEELLKELEIVLAEFDDLIINLDGSKLRSIQFANAHQNIRFLKNASHYVESSFRELNELFDFANILVAKETKRFSKTIQDTTSGILQNVEKYRTAMAGWICLEGKAGLASVQGRLKPIVESLKLPKEEIDVKDIIYLRSVAQDVRAIRHDVDMTTTRHKRIKTKETTISDLLKELNAYNISHPQMARSAFEANAIKSADDLVGIAKKQDDFDEACKLLDESQKLLESALNGIRMKAVIETPRNTITNISQNYGNVASGNYHSLSQAATNTDFTVTPTPLRPIPSINLHEPLDFSLTEDPLLKAIFQPIVPNDNDSTDLKS